MFYMCKNEAKTSNNARHFLQSATSWKEIESRNTKEQIKWVICGAKVFLLFWLDLDSQSFKIVRNFICPILLSFFLMADGDENKS